jgi:hypothetical protein
MRLSTAPVEPNQSWSESLNHIKLEACFWARAKRSSKVCKFPTFEKLRICLTSRTYPECIRQASHQHILCSAKERDRPSPGRRVHEPHLGRLHIVEIGVVHTQPLKTYADKTQRDSTQEVGCACTFVLLTPCIAMMCLFRDVCLCSRDCLSAWLDVGRSS